MQKNPLDIPKNRAENSSTQTFRSQFQQYTQQNQPIKKDGLTSFTLEKIKNRKRRNRTGKLNHSIARCCAWCGAKSTPEWRSGADDDEILCNACGLQYRNKKKEAAASKQRHSIQLLLNNDGNTQQPNPPTTEQKTSTPKQISTVENKNDSAKKQKIVHEKEQNYEPNNQIDVNGVDKNPQNKVPDSILMYSSLMNFAALFQEPKNNKPVHSPVNYPINNLPLPAIVISSRSPVTLEPSNSSSYTTDLLKKISRWQPNETSLSTDKEPLEKLSETSEDMTDDFLNFMG